MSDAETTRDGDEPERPFAAGEPAVEGEGLVIITGSGGVEEDEEEPLPTTDTGAAPTRAEFAGAEEAGPAAEEGDSTGTDLTLDELVAEMADASTLVTGRSAPEAPAPVVTEHVDVLESLMTDTLAELPAVEARMWTKLPFWVLEALWVLSVGVLTFLLWPNAKAVLAAIPLYDALVFGGAALVAVSAVVGAVVWSRARSMAEMADRSVVGRVVLLRALGWIAAGVALWVVSMVVLSLHSQGVIP